MVLRSPTNKTHAQNESTKNSPSGDGASRRARIRILVPTFIFFGYWWGGMENYCTRKKTKKEIDFGGRNAAPASFFCALDVCSFDELMFPRPPPSIEVQVVCLTRSGRSPNWSHLATDGRPHWDIAVAALSQISTTCRC